MRTISIARMLTMGFVLVLILGAFSESARAQSLGTAAWDRKTTITINTAWEVPGTTLAPGTYVLRLLDLGEGGGATRTVVQVFSQDEKKILATVLGLTAYRTNTADDSVFHFYEAEQGTPGRLHTWFYPSFDSGIEFVYPKRSAGN
jgi:hypothetical protein